LYELTTGRTPFDARTPLLVLKKLTEERHRPVRELNPETPEWLAGVIDRLLAKSPDDRFHSAREVAEILDRAWTLLRTSSDAVPVCPVKRARRIRQGAALMLAVAAGALLTALLVILWPRGSREAQSPAPLAVLRGNSGTVWGVAFSPDGRTLATPLEEGP